jgi:hypothetical protein
MVREKKGMRHKIYRREMRRGTWNYKPQGKGCGKTKTTLERGF